MKFILQQISNSNKMFGKLRAKWGVGPLRLFLILCTFALGGSLCGLAGKWILSFLPIQNKILFFVVYIILVTLLWPLCVLCISVFFGQFQFFKKYIRKMGQRMFGNFNQMLFLLLINVLS